LFLKLIELLKIKPHPQPETIEGMIERIAKEEGVAPELALKVAKCESDFDPNAKHTNPKGSIDRGLYQWNDYWHKEVTDEMAYNPETATRLFCKAVKQGHLNWWNASKECWSKY